MLFDKVIGQQEVKQHLAEMVLHNRLSHALLFLGKEGSGALPLAIAFAQYISLLPVASTLKAATGNALFSEEDIPLKLPETIGAVDAWMQKQPSFGKAAEMVHPDIHFSYPVIKKDVKDKNPPISADWAAEWREFIQQYPYGNIYDWLQFIGAENKQGNITALECNEIIHKLSLKSFESGYKILLMWMPEYLGREGNKLLKLIEEPPDDTLFILVAENESAVLSTILSRCQLVKVPALQAKEVEQALIEKNIDSNQAKLVAYASEGNFREALQLLQHADEDYHSLLRDWLNATLKNQPVLQLKIVETIARLGREKQKQFLKYFLHLLEQALRLDVNEGLVKETILAAMTPNEQAFAGKLNKMVNMEQKEAIATELDKASYFIERNANAKILFHALSIKLFHIIKNGVVLSV